MKRFQKILLCCIVLFVISWIRPSLAADAVVGSGIAASCTESAFNDALAIAQSGSGTITFNCGLATIPFSSQKIISSHVVIDGGGMITLSGEDVTRLFYVQNGRSLVLRNIILTDGFSGANYGGAIYVESNGVLTVEGSTIQNSATDGQAGGAIIDFGGTVTIVDSIIDNNQSNYGAINSIGLVEIIRSTIKNNQATLGGAALSVGGDVTITESVFHHNQAPVGGAMLITNAGDVSISDSTFHSNTANGVVVEDTGGGAIINDGYLSITRSTFEANSSNGSGGAIQNGRLGSVAEAFISQSAFIGNQAVHYGGGIYNQEGVLQLINSTLSTNLAQESGGGLSSFLGPATLIYVTAADNVGGNLNQIGDFNFDSDLQQILLSYTVLTGSEENCQLTGNPAPDPIPYFASQDYNLSSDDTCTTYLTEANDTYNTPAALGALADNGGVTVTHLPLAGSPLIDTAVCQPDFFIDQRDVVRPQNGLCDIGAVEIASSTTGPTPTPLPTNTAVPSPTPPPTPTVPPPGAAAPAFNPIRLNGGVRPTIKLNVNHAYGGQQITVSGTGVNGHNKVRIFSIEKGQSVGAVETAVINNNYQAELYIPYTMPVGPTQLCAAAVGAANGELACTDFTVDPMPNGGATGQIQNGDFGSWNARANLIDTRGRLVQTTAIDTNGAFQFNNIPPGVYQYAVDGQTSGGGVPSGELTISPANNELIDAQLSDAISCALRPRSSYLLLDRNNPARTDGAAIDFFSPVVEPKLNPLVVAEEISSFDWGKFQREKFGYYISGVHRPEKFFAIPQVNGSIEKVQFNLRGVDGSLILAVDPPQFVAPYTVSFNMGLLPPSDHRGDPYIEVIPYVDGEKQCPAVFPVQMLADPMKQSAFRSDSATKWDPNGYVYRFDGVIPNIPGLPVNFPVPPEGVDIIDHFGRFQNRADAGIYVRGVLTEDGVVWMEGVNARAELTLMSVPLIEPHNFASPPLPRANRGLDQLWELSYKIPPGGGRVEVLPPIEVGIPFIDTPVFSFFGIDFVVGTSALAGFTAYLDGEVFPFKPKVRATLTPSGYGEGELTLGLGLGGVVSAGGGMGFRLQLDAPVSATIDATVPEFSMTTSVCPTISTFVHVYVRALIKREDLRKQIASYSPGCYPLRPAGEQPEPPDLNLPTLLAAPSVAAATDGQVLSAYVQNTAVSGDPQLQIKARFLDSNTGLWQTADILSDPNHTAGNPVVTFAGSSNLPLVVWVANTFDDNANPAISDDFNAQVNRQELFYSWHNGVAWQSPQRLTNDLFADGMPSITSTPDGAILTWVRDTDGNPQTRTDQRIAVAEFDDLGQTFGPITLLTGGATGLNTASCRCRQHPLPGVDV